MSAIKERDTNKSLEQSQERRDDESKADRSLSLSAENDIFSISTHLVPPAQVKSAGTTSIGFDGLLPEPLLLHEDLREGCGGQLWPAGMVLSKYMLTYHKNSLSSNHILEIGAGGGLVGLAVARGCDLSPTKSKMMITDQEPMLALMQRNIALNKLSDKVEATVYDWGAPPLTKPEHPDIILAADCVYFEPAFPWLLQTLTDLIGSDSICYFCFKKRRKADMRFIRDMRKKFEVGEIKYDGRDTNQKEGIYLLQVKRKGRKSS